MVAALKHMSGQNPKPVVIANHPARSAPALGVYGLDTPAEFRNWNDAAPDVAVGMEGAPGHQAMGLMRERFGRSEEHTSELQSLMRISYAVFCLKKKKNKRNN